MEAEKEFAENVARNIRTFLRPEYADVECSVMENVKNNGVKHVGIQFKRPGIAASPVVYVEPYFKDAGAGKPLAGIMDSIAKVAERGMEMEKHPAARYIEDYGEIKDRLRLRLVSTKANRRELAGMPCRSLEDLTLYPVIEVAGFGNGGTGSIKVKSEIACRWGVGMDEIFRQATENMEREGEPVVIDMNRIPQYGTAGELQDFLEEKAENLQDFLEEKAGEDTEPGILYVLTNRDKNYGAAMIACPGVSEKIDAAFPEGIYILPSSVHEVLVVPKGCGRTAKELGEMVRNVNREALDPEDILSDHVYEYDREKGTIRTVKESLNRWKVEVR